MLVNACFDIGEISRKISRIDFTISRLLIGSNNLFYIVNLDGSDFFEGQAFGQSIVHHELIIVVFRGVGNRNGNLEIDGISDSSIRELLFGLSFNDFLIRGDVSILIHINFA